VLENKGFIVLTGGVGTGKTALIRSLLAGLHGEIVIAFIENPGLSTRDLLNVISNELGMDPAGRSKSDFQIEFDKLLDLVHGSSKRMLIIIDEAQRLTNELLEEIRVLFSIGYENRKLVNVLFVGQLEFDRILADPSNRALRVQIAVSCRLSPLSPEETGAYIRHRLKVAGSRRELFTPGAVQEVFNFSKGIPRLVNILCDRALVSGYLRNRTGIDHDLIRECAAELEMVSDAAEIDIQPGPRAEPEPEIHEARDHPKEGVRPTRVQSKWPAAAALCAAGLLVFVIVLSRAPERNLLQAPVMPPNQNVKAGQPIEGSFSESSPGQPPALDPPVAEELSGAETQPLETKEKFHLFFKPVSSELEDDSYKILRQAAALLAASPSAEITLIYYPARDDLPFLRAKLAELRTTSVKTALAAQPNFKGRMTVVTPDEQEAGSHRGSPAGGDSRALVELRIKPAMNVKEN
jgi:type II secretory pathway predicted ATPase ExeA/outer membrane protein OmpA-like peptidoglycan-associated protein